MYHFFSFANIYKILYIVSIFAIFILFLNKTPATVKMQQNLKAKNKKNGGFGGLKKGINFVIINMTAV